jgi:hypothetical protein
MAFKALQIRYIRFLGPEKDPAEFTFTPGLNILWGSSDTGKTFLVQAMDFMLGAGSKLKDIPERAGYDRILLGITTAEGKDYTLLRSVDGGSFRRFDGLLMDSPPRRLARRYRRSIQPTTTRTSHTGFCSRLGWTRKTFFSIPRRARPERSGSGLWRISASSSIRRSRRQYHRFMMANTMIRRGNTASSSSC